MLSDDTDFCITHIFLATLMQKIGQLWLFSVQHLLLLQSTMGFLNQLAPLTPRLGVGSALNPASSDLFQPPHALLSPALAGSLAQALSCRATSFSSLQLFSSQGVRLKTHDLSVQSTWPRYSLPQIWGDVAKGTRGRGAGAYLHADNRVDEEQHGDEKGDIRERLEEKQRLAQREHPVPPDGLGAD